MIPILKKWVKEMSVQRNVILQVIQASDRHLSADEIYWEAKQLLPSIAVGTVYRNLNLLTKEGLLVRIPMPEGADRYDRNPEPHDHYVCTVCGMLLDMQLGDLTALMERATGAEITQYTVCASGICPGCRAKKRDAL